MIKFSERLALRVLVYAALAAALIHDLLGVSLRGFTDSTAIAVAVAAGVLLLASK
jgi:hypothetical protein